MRHFIPGTRKPLQGFFIEGFYIAEAPVVQKIPFDVLNDTFNFSLTFRIRFSTKMKLKVPFLRIRPERIGKKNIAFVFIDDKDPILIIDNLLCNAVEKGKGLLMARYGQFRGEAPLIKPDIFVTRP